MALHSSFYLYTPQNSEHTPKILSGCCKVCMEGAVVIVMYAWHVWFELAGEGIRRRCNGSGVTFMTSQLN